MDKDGNDGGKFRIVCPDPADPENEDKFAKTRPLKIGEGSGSLQYYMDRDIPHLTFRHRIYVVQRTDQYDQSRNGKKYIITMEGLTEVPQCFIEEDSENPFEATLELKASKLRTYAESLWWE